MKLYNLSQQMIYSDAYTNFTIKQKQAHFQILIPTNV